MTVESKLADARRNRATILDVAQRLVAAEGVRFSVRRLAAEAGVGVGTVYRNFPTRDHLLEAVLGDVFEETTALCNDLLESCTGWEGLLRFFEETLERSATNRGVRDILADPQQTLVESSLARAGVWEALDRLIQRAKAEGALRQDFVVEDVPLIYWGCERVIELSGDTAPGLWRRQLAFSIQGIQAGKTSELPHPPQGSRQTLPPRSRVD